MRLSVLLPLAGLIATGIMASAALPVPAGAQMFSPSYRFLEAVRERDGNAATELLNEPGTTIVNTRDVTTGRTALHIVIERRDLTWLNFLLQRGADPRIADRAGLTPLRQATEIGFADGVRALLARGAAVNQANSRGETALHAAVHRRDVTLVRLLLDAGADADLTDSVAGKSARDYASEDPRAAAVLAAINAPRNPRTPAQGPAVAGPN